MSLLLRMKATWRAPVSELKLQLLPFDQLELSESFLDRSVWDAGLILCRRVICWLQESAPSHVWASWLQGCRAICPVLPCSCKFGKVMRSMGTTHRHGP